MRSPKALSLLVLALSLPALAQRGGGGHGGGGMHGGGGFSGGGGMRSGGGFASGGMRGGGGFTGRGSGFGSAYRGGSPMATRGVTGNRGSYARYPGTYARTPYGSRPAFYSRNGNFGHGGYANTYRHNGYGYGNGYGYRYPGIYNYGYPGYLNYGYRDAFFDSYDPFWGNDNGLGIGDSLAGADAYPQPDVQSGYDPQAAAMQAYAPQQVEPAGQLYPPQGYAQQLQTPAPGWYGPYLVPPAATPAAEDTTTLIFKDGRPPQQIRNYALTHDAIYITGAHIYQIPLNQLDLAATARVNAQAGVSFQVP